MKSNKGFSLVELIVVIAIMAIIAAVAVPVYTGYITKANTANVQSTIDELERVIQIAQVEYSQTPFTVSATAPAAGDTEVTYTFTDGSVTGGSEKAIADIKAVLGDNVDTATANTVKVTIGSADPVKLDVTTSF